MCLSDVIRDYGIIVREVELEGMRGSVKKTRDGYLILIHSQMADNRKYRTLQHELAHIVLGHLDEHREIAEEVKEEEVRLFLGGQEYEESEKRKLSVGRCDGA